MLRGTEYIQYSKEGFPSRDRDCPSHGEDNSCNDERPAIPVLVLLSIMKLVIRGQIQGDGIRCFEARQSARS